MPIATGTSAITEFGGLGEDIKNLLEVINSSQIQQALFPMKVVFIIISILFLFAIFYFVFKTSFMQSWFLGGLMDFLFPNLFKNRRITRKWYKIKKEMDSDSTDQWKLVVLEAGNLIDEVLKNVGHTGETLKEKIDKLIPDEILRLAQLKDACQVCENIAKDPDYLLSKEIAEKTLEAIEDALKDLNIL